MVSTSEIESIVREVLASLNYPARSREGEAPAEPLKSPKMSAVPAARQEPRPPEMKPRPPEIVKPYSNFREEVGKRQQGIDLSNLPSSQVESLSPAGVPHTEHCSMSHSLM